MAGYNFTNSDTSRKCAEYFHKLEKREHEPECESCITDIERKRIEQGVRLIILEQRLSDDIAKIERLISIFERLAVDASSIDILIEELEQRIEGNNGR